MAHVTVSYRYGNKVYIGILKGSNVDHFERLFIHNVNEFSENIFYVMMVGEGKTPDIVEMDRVFCDFSIVTEEEDFVTLGNLALGKFKLNITFH